MCSLYSFTVSIHFLRYIFLPLLSPLIAHFRFALSGGGGGGGGGGR
jgi:hypothetical protein